MADETWSAKVSPEVKEELGQMVKDSGLSSKEFLEQLLNQHKIGLLQVSDAQRSEDIQQVSYHLDKIKNQFVGLVEKGIDLKDKFSESLAQESTLHKSIVDQIQTQSKQAQEDRDKAILDKSTLEGLMQEINTRNEELESSNKTHRITIQMQQDKLGNLETRIESVAELEEEVSRLNQEAQAQAKRIESLEQEAENHKRQLVQTQAAKEAQEKDAIKAHEQMIQVHGLEVQRATLEIEKKLLEENKKIRDEYFLKVEALTSKNQELTEKLHQMELEKKESAAPNIKGKTKPGVPSGRE
ncbi:conserved hypothetical protein [Candidatus Desulfosporosinus infrequens]|uniref:Uncharacterized protein n=1 Tax=Candidatus Desulfosporosinus infrequens TaxID=2043169 RepID=A0A2U3LRB3_9FIRM|nr:conserved hypothetical protein [Candidatus Desulfosporosinus infrequens]